MIAFDFGSGSIDAEHDIVAFGGNDNGFPVPCGITTAALMELWHVDVTEAERLNMLDWIQEEVFELAREKYEGRRFEPDGSILVGGIG